MHHLIRSIAFALALQSCLAQDCSVIGPQCDSTCSNIILCASVGGPSTQLSKCNPNTFCGLNGTTYDCSFDHCKNPNAPHRFLCMQPGVFPSPYQCDKYFICTDISENPAKECTCPLEEHFDIPTQACKKGTCVRDPIDCLNAGQQGEIESYCYACTGNYDAFVYRCDSSFTEPIIIPKAATCGPYTGIDNDNNNPTSSTDDPTSSTESSTSSTESSTSSTESSTSSTESSTSSTESSTSSTEGPTTSTTTVKIPTTTKKTSMCEVKGQKIPDPTDCRKYYLCDADLKATHITCPDNQYYDKMRYGCVQGVCYNN